MRVIASIIAGDCEKYTIAQQRPLTSSRNLAPIFLKHSKLDTVTDKSMQLFRQQNEVEWCVLREEISLFQSPNASACLRACALFKDSPSWLAKG